MNEAEYLMKNYGDRRGCYLAMSWVNKCETFEFLSHTTFFFLTMINMQKCKRVSFRRAKLINESINQAPYYLLSLFGTHG